MDAARTILILLAMTATAVGSPEPAADPPPAPQDADAQTPASDAAAEPSPAGQPADGEGLSEAQASATEPAGGPDTNKPEAKRPARKSLADLAGRRGDANKVLWQMLASVLVIGGVGLVAMVLIRRFGAKLKLSPGRKIRVLETVHLGPRKSVHLLEVSGRELLLSSSRDGVRMLTDLSASPRGGARFPSHRELEARAEKMDAEAEDAPQLAAEGAQR